MKRIRPERRGPMDIIGLQMACKIKRNLLWKIGHVLPKEIKHFKKHSTALKSHMLKVEVDLTVG
ncbi:hypothetical protein JHK82_023382 [Glycine max]|nr:hypothetical protein JHK85_023918 [Glycine max]KAG5027530.1 hypothetical protein JHK86_023444 [Glycine max]KAG5138651.1 hypothetical protein JHK82_023382 [Glycine max]